MALLVTGAAGFIGFNLINSLLKDGYKVVGVDSLCDYYDVDLKYKRLELLGINREDISEYKIVDPKKGFYFVKVNIENKEEIDKLFNIFHIEYVINLAAQPGVRYSIENPDIYIQDNIIGFMNLLNISVKYNINHFVYASSSSVYGLNQTIPYKESCCADHPVSLYAATKRCDEILAHSYSTLYNLPTTGLRFFTVYGPWGRPDMAAYKFVDAIINEKPLNIYNNGNMMRDFTYIDDVVCGIKLVLHNPPVENEINIVDEDGSISSSPFEIYNIGSSNPVSLLKYIQIFEKILKKEASKNYMPMQKGDVVNTFADITKIREKLNFKPQVKIEEGIKKYVEWHLHYYCN